MMQIVKNISYVKYKCNQSQAFLDGYVI